MTEPPRPSVWAFLRRNLVTILFLSLVVLQIATLVVLLRIAGIVDEWSCGRYRFPCWVSIKPDR